MNVGVVGTAMRAMLSAAVNSGKSLDEGVLLKAPEIYIARRYPEWYSLRKTRGRRDASLRSRSNRRKAAR